ncbi:hypothetical protein [Aureibacter tunicatorum]|uniref:Uncharacterized protein n=1 Tax=Aureibacter tunicatorum TaxID=866807 RepID=A0AAE3XU52_9BACT|nr:hypothetical protein [Aureibacter tunicatorum]MDR6241744.1 hypothetical protein [Aureibacter tunicatorum]BDD07394.1 hypothetical protein AUTU_48770 [Aureibacter tunicatorum]
MKGYHNAQVNGNKQQRDFTIKIKLKDVNGAKMIEHTVLGENVVIKEPNTRSHVDSAVQDTAHKEVKESDKFKKIPEDFVFSASHVLADTFLGPGNKKALNLLITSQDYNVKEMGKAEKNLRATMEDIEDEMKAAYNADFATFDIQITSQIYLKMNYLKQLI